MTHIMRINEFVKENFQTVANDTDETKQLVLNKLDEIGIKTDGIVWMTDTYFATKDGCNGSIFDSEEDAVRSVTNGEDHQNAMDFVSGMMDDDELIDYVVDCGIGRNKAYKMVKNQDWNAVVAVIVKKEGAKFFLSGYDNNVYELENGKLLYY